jgi:hypothetical protein
MVLIHTSFFTPDSIKHVSPRRRLALSTALHFNSPPISNSISPKSEEQGRRKTNLAAKSLPLVAVTLLKPFGRLKISL